QAEVVDEPREPREPAERLGAAVGLDDLVHRVLEREHRPRGFRGRVPLPDPGPGELREQPAYVGEVLVLAGERGAQGTVELAELIGGDVRLFGPLIEQPSVLLQEEILGAPDGCFCLDGHYYSSAPAMPPWRHSTGTTI